MNGPTHPLEYVTSMALTNDRPEQIEFILEPWGEIYLIPPGERVRVVARGPANGMLDVHIAATKVTIWSWPRSRVSLSHGAESLDEAQNPLAP
jgi:hypothetical protein